MGFGRLLRGVVASALVLATSSIAQAQQPPTVAAASDLQFALEDVAQVFQRETGKAVRLSFGSSGNFHRQIAQGGPFQIFMSADEGYVLDLAIKGLTEDDGVLYAEGRLALIVPTGSPLAADGSLDDLSAALAAGKIAKFAIANPDHAPYGRAARQALEAKGLWAGLQGHLVFGENVSQAAQFATSGSAEGGIIAYSLALSPKVSQLGTWALIPADQHAPLRQRMVLVKGAGETARAFYDFMQTPPARAVLERYGFTLPEGR
ncbi:MAG: molybdate ABC transporter substrate-binding protein [Rhodospirillaceae bacterium]